MAYDPYALCPCGSGKKLKFCCQAIAEEMERISRLIEDNQLRAALKQLETLSKRQPANEWVLTTRALVLIDSGESLAARDLLQPWVAAHPDSDFATVLYALAQLHSEGYDAAKKSIQRAYQKGAKKYPSLVSGLAGTVAIVMAERGQFLAVRECLSLSLRFASEEDRQEIFIRLLEFDNNADFYYPLRSLHPLPQVTVPDEHDKDYKRGLKLAMIGCWDTAAETFSALADKVSSRGEMLQSAGLCWAWDGNSTKAAQTLHQAAQCLADRPVAVECEVLAQLMDLDDETRPSHALLSQDGEIHSVSRLLTTLDEQPRFVRMTVSQEQTPPGGLKPSAAYSILDRLPLSASDVPQLTLDNVPQVWAQLVIFDALQEQPARTVISGMAGEAFDGAWNLLKSAVGEQITWSQEPPESIDEFAVELDNFRWQMHFPPKTPLKVRHRLERQQWERAIADRWLTQPLAALSGKSPTEAAKVSGLQLATLAAAYVLDAIAEQRRHALDLAGLLGKLGLEPLPTLTLPADGSPNAMSVMQLHRLDVTALNDPQLLSVVNRALLIHHDAFLAPSLREVIQRPECTSKLDLPRVYEALINLSAQHGELSEALHWVDEARKQLIRPQTGFEEVWQWDLRELMLRMTDPADPGLPKLLQKFATFYGPKIPQLRSYLEAIIEEAGVPSPWSSSGILTPDALAGGGTGGGLWTPDQETGATAGGKLWVPGQ